MKELPIKVDPRIPLKCYIADISPCPQQWLYVLRIFLVLKGELCIHAGNQAYVLSDDDLILINPYEVFSISDGHGRMVTCDIDLREIDERFALPRGTRFSCCSVTAGDQTPIIVLKSLIAQMIKLNTIIPIETTYLNISFFYSILHHLISYFTLPGSVDIPDTKRFQRMDAVARFINEKCHDPHLSLQDVADHFFLSAPYMSRLIHSYFGSTFTDFLKNARLQNALPHLLEGDPSIDFIAESSGFPNTRSFIAAFKAHYGVTPVQYRKSHFGNKGSSRRAVLDSKDPMSQDDLTLLTKYLDKSGNPITITSPPYETVKAPLINTLQRGTRLQHTWRKMISVCSAQDLLTAECRQALQQLQQAVGFEYIYFHGLLDDDMMLCPEDSTGAVLLNFVLVDMIFDFLRSIDLRPFLELSFMPSALSQADSHSACFAKPVVSIPQSMTTWKQLVGSLIRHLQQRYGADEVSHWPIFVRTAPDHSPSRFDLDSIEAYFALYLETWRAVKACDPSIEVGAPIFLAETAQAGPLTGYFSKLCKQAGCSPDFWCCSCFLIDDPSLSADTDPVLSPSPMLRPAEDDLRFSISRVKENLRKGLAGSDRLYIKWGLSNAPCELLSDTVFMSAYIAKTILENYDSAHAFCYWSAIDEMGKSSAASNLYHGGSGLFTYNAIPKASYYAMTLLARLGDTKLAAGPGYFITCQGTGIQILCYNYQHFSRLYTDGKLSDAMVSDRYAPFPDNGNKLFMIPLSGLSAKEYTRVETRINALHGSSFDQWLSLGGLPLESAAEEEYLRRISVPLTRKSRQQASAGSLTLHCSLSAHEICLLEIKPFG